MFAAMDSLSNWERAAPEPYSLSINFCNQSLTINGSPLSSATFEMYANNTFFGNFVKELNLSWIDWLEDGHVKMVLEFCPHLTKICLISCVCLKNPDILCGQNLRHVLLDGCWNLETAFLTDLEAKAPNWNGLLNVDLLEDMQQTELVQVVILPGAHGHGGSWVDARILEKIGPFKYHIFVLETEQFNNAVGFSGQIAVNISRQHLRKTCFCNSRKNGLNFAYM